MLLGAVSVTGIVSDESEHDSVANNIQQLRPVARDNFGRVHDDITSSIVEDEEQQQQQQQQQWPLHPSQSEGRPEREEVLLEATLVENHNDAFVESSNCNSDRNNFSQVAVLSTTSVVEAEKLICGFSKRQWLYLGALLTCFLVVLAVAVPKGLAVQDNSSNNSITATAAEPLGDTIAPSAAPRPTLELIQDRGILRCGIFQETLTFFQWAETYDSQEDQVDFVLCRAFAAAILGNESLHEIVLGTQETDFAQLQDGTVDMVLSHLKTGMQRDVWEPGINAGFTFTIPYVYSDFVYGGLPEYVACADDNMNSRGNCSGLRICTNDDTFYSNEIANELPESFLIKRQDTLDIVLGFMEGACNLIPSENSGIMEWGLELLGYQEEYVRGTTLFQKDCVGVATRDDDPQFSDFVNIVLMGLFAAEQANFTRDTAHEMATAAVLGEEIVAAVRASGSYKDVYEQGIEPFLHRQSWNLLNDGTTGLLYTLVLGKVNQVGPGPVKGGTLQHILDRPNPKLRCGIRLDRPGFASLGSDGVHTGIDVDFCMVIAASALFGDGQAIVFVPVRDEADGYKKLQTGKVDVLAGFEWNIVNDYQEPTTGDGFAFSQPYFYRPIGGPKQQNATNLLFDGDNRCLVTRQDDAQFSSFVYWSVAVTVFAEERAITQATANDMPDVNIFGEDYRRMFRDAVFFAGNYGEVYERNLGTLLPERGRNTINSIESPGPQIYVPPGYF